MFGSLIYLKTSPLKGFVREEDLLGLYDYDEKTHLVETTLEK